MAGSGRIAAGRNATQRPGTAGAGVYTGSERAQALFPKGYDVLLKLLLEEIGARQAATGWSSLLDGVSARLAEQYGGKAGGQELAERLQVLAEAFDAHGIPITIVEQGDAVAVHEYSCPYYNVAQSESHVCAVEKQMLEQVLGRDVELTRRMVDGHAGCDCRRADETGRRGDKLSGLRCPGRPGVFGVSLRIIPQSW